MLEAGRSVIYLVPEIGLTPLLLNKISNRFPGQAVVLHSVYIRYLLPMRIELQCFDWAEGFDALRTA